MATSNIPFELSDYVLRKAFTLAAQRQGWLNDANIIAAVSGGGDSTSLLWMAAKFTHAHITVLHVHHGMRPDADTDADYVQQLAERLGCEFLCQRVHVPESRLRGESLEVTGRRLRHESIISAAQSLKVHTVLLGHNRDDLAETVLFNLLRGTGIRGAVGITECTQLEGVRLCRPLLSFRRETLREVLRVRGIDWREDSTNANESFTRNYIRRKLIPELEGHVNSHVIDHLADFGQDMRLIRDREDTESTTLFTECMEAESPLTLNIRRLRRLDPHSLALVIREAGRRLSNY